MNEPLVSVVVATMGRGSLANLLDSITLKESHEIVLVMPKTTTLPIELLDKHNPVLLYDEGRGCVAAFRQGFEYSSGYYTIHVNDDCTFLPYAIENMLRVIGDKDVMGAFAFQEPDTNGQFLTRQIYGVNYANFGCIKKELFAKVGYWDSVNFRHYGADPNCGLVLKSMGYETIPVMSARIIHHCIVDSFRKEHLREEASNKLHELWGATYANARS